MQLAILLSLALQSSTAPVEQEITAPYVALDLFKNGEAVVTRELAIPGNGLYVLHEDFEHRHGTLRIDALGSLELTRTKRLQAVPPSQIDATAGFDLRAAMIGRQAVVRLTGSDQVITGVLRAVHASVTGQWVNQPRPQPYSRPDQYGIVQYDYAPSYRGPEYLVLETDGGLRFVSPAQMASLEVQDCVLESHPVPAVVSQVERPAMLFKASRFDDSPSTARITYLTTGITWAPSYSVDLLDGQVLELVQNATIRNELVDLDGVATRLVTGVPVMKCRSVFSPFGSRTGLMEFFDQLVNSERSDYWRWNRQPEARYMSQSVSLHTAPDFSQITDSLDSATEDLQYREIGALQLRTNDSAFLELERARTEYEQLVEVHAAPRGDDQVWRPSKPAADGEPRAKAWNVLRFRNPFAGAISTGPVTVLHAGDFVSQVEMSWIGEGEVAHLRTSRALSIEAASDEWEVVSSRVPRSHGDRYGSTKYAGSLQLTNRRAEAIRLRATAEFFGLFHSAESTAQVVAVARRVPNASWQLNPHTEISWELELAPGESITLNYEYGFKTYQ